MENADSGLSKHVDTNPKPTENGDSGFPTENSASTSATSSIVNFGKKDEDLETLIGKAGGMLNKYICLIQTILSLNY